MEYQYEYSLSGGSSDEPESKGVCCFRVKWIANVLPKELKRQFNKMVEIITNLAKKIYVPH